MIDKSEKEIYLLNNKMKQFNSVIQVEKQEALKNIWNIHLDK